MLWKRLWLRRGTIGLGVVAAVVVAGVGGTALAGHLPGGVMSYTGCLNQFGAVKNIKEGDSPRSPCTGTQLVAHFSGGDITSIAAGTGLTGGAENGAATLAVDTKYALPQNCAGGQVVKWDGSRWVCAADEGTGSGSLVTREVLVSSDQVENTSDGFDLKVAQANCGAGEVISGGGFRIFASSRPIAAQVVVTDSVPSFSDGVGDPPTIWSVFAQAPAGIGYWGIDARAICAQLAPSG